MSTTIKYTKDGKKVAVIGKLNNSEYIVQEIFVSGEAEIPAGENFVASGLLDSPAVSWKEQRLADIERSFERQQTELFSKSERLARDMRIAHGKAEAKIKALLEFIREAQPEDAFQGIVDFLAGRITHVAVFGYRPSVVEIDDSTMFSLYDGRVDGLKLMSIFGSSHKGAARLDYRINDYRDGSGSSWTKVVPCRSRDEAVAALQEAYDEICEQFIADPDKHSSIWTWSENPDLITPDPARRLIQSRRIDSIKKNIDKKKEELEKELEKLSIAQGGGE